MASIKVTLELDDNGYITKIKAADAATEKLGKSAANAGQQGASGIGKMTDVLDTLGSKLATIASAATAAFAAIGASSIKMADDMADTAAAFGLSAARIYQLNEALQESGGRFGDAGLLLRGFTQSLGDVEKGSKETIDAFAKLGIGKQALETLNDDQLFQAVVNGLGKMEAGFERNRLAMVLTGRAGDGIDWKKMADGSSKAIDPEMEARLQAGADAMAALEGAFRNFQLVALEVLAPIIAYIKDLNINADDVRKAIQILGAVLAAAFAATVVGQIIRVVALIKELGGVIRAAATAQAFLVGLSGAGLAVVAASAAAAGAAYYALGKMMDDAAAKAKTSPSLPTNPPGGGGTGTTVRTVGKTSEQKQQENQLERERSRQRSRAAEVIAQIAAQTASLQEKYDIELKNIGLTDDQIRLNNELSSIKAKQRDDVAKIQGLDKLADSEKAAKIAEINEKYIQQEAILRQGLSLVQQTNYAEQTRLALIQDAIADRQEEIRQTYALADLENQRQVALGLRTTREGSVISQLLKLEGDYVSKKETLQKQYAEAKNQIDQDNIQRELDNLEQSYQNNKEYVEKKKKLDEEVRNSYSAGFRSVFENLSDSLTPFQVAADATSAVFGNLESAISEFARTGKFNFGEFAKSIIRDLIAITLRTIILRTVLAAFGGLFGGGGGGGTTMALNTQVPDTGLRFAAAGGPIRANQGYIVGEKGPEFFMPNTSGTMIPNHALGGTTNVVYNIQAVDARSFKDLVAQDPEFIYSVTQVGARRQPR